MDVVAEDVGFLPSAVLSLEEPRMLKESLLEAMFSGAQEYFSVERTCCSGLDVGYGVVGVFVVRELDKIGLVNECCQCLDE